MQVELDSTCFLHLLNHAKENPSHSQGGILSLIFIFSSTPFPTWLCHRTRLSHPFTHFVWKVNKVLFYGRTNLCYCQSLYVKTGERELWFSVSSFLDRVVMISPFLAGKGSSQCLCASLMLDLWASAGHWGAFSSLVCLQRVDVFHENLLVFENILLHFHVQAVIHSVSCEAGTEFSSSPSRMPRQACGYWQHSFTYPCQRACPLAGPGVLPASSLDSHKLLDDQPVLIRFWSC